MELNTGNFTLLQYIHTNNIVLSFQENAKKVQLDGLGRRQQVC
jgi:hypothetical protein